MHGRFFSSELIDIWTVWPLLQAAEVLKGQETIGCIVKEKQIYNTKHNAPCTGFYQKSIFTKKELWDFFFFFFVQRCWNFLNDLSKPANVFSVLWGWSHHFVDCFTFSLTHILQLNTWTTLTSQLSPEKCLRNVYRIILKLISCSK